MKVCVYSYIPHRYVSPIFVAGLRMHCSYSGEALCDSHDFAMSQGHQIVYDLSLKVI